MDQP